MSQNEKVIARIKKMLAISSDERAPEGERDAALRAVHATLAKHNLDMGCVVGSGIKETRLEAECKITNHAWARGAIKSIGQLFFCEYFYIAHRDSQQITHVFVGLESNVATAKEMSSYIIKSIEREARSATKQAGAAGKYHRDFCKGAADQICWRIQNIKAQNITPEQTAEASAVTALAISSLYEQEKLANEAYLGEHHDVRPVKSRLHAAGAHAYSAGVRFGDTVGLNRQIENSKDGSKKMLN